MEILPGLLECLQSGNPSRETSCEGVSLVDREKSRGDCATEYPGAMACQVPVQLKSIRIAAAGASQCMWSKSLPLGERLALP